MERTETTERTEEPQRDISAGRFYTADGVEYWIAGIWNLNGHLLWSSEPDSYDTEAAALEAARLRNVDLVDRHG